MGVVRIKTFLGCFPVAINIALGQSKRRADSHLLGHYTR